MKFVGNPEHTQVSNNCPKVDIDLFVSILWSVSRDVGEETRKRLRAAIVSPPTDDNVDMGVRFWDTPIYGDSYVYLWFDLHGELFYVGKGCWNRAWAIKQRSAEFQEKAASGYCKILASNLAEDYALDLEKIIIMEAVRCGKKLLNKTGGGAIDAVQYCSGDRDHLLWYWDHLGVISRFSELTKQPVYYDARVYRKGALDERAVWWDTFGAVKTNDPVVLAEIEKERKRKEKMREYQRNRRERMAAQKPAI